MPPESARSGAGLALRVNGEALRCRAATLHELLAARGLDPSSGAFACAVNGGFVPRAQWAAQQLADGDCIDIVAPVVGG